MVLGTTMAIATAAMLGAGVGAGISAAMNSGDKGGGGGSMTPVSTTDVGRVTPESIETQAAQRRLARLSKYFTSPSGILNDANTGTTGVMG